MRTQKIFFFLAFSFLMVSCGNSETTSSKVSSEVISNKELNVEPSSEQKSKMDYAEKELIDESKPEDSSSKTESPKSVEVKNTPKAVKTSNLIDNKKSSTETNPPSITNQEEVEKELGFVKEEEIKENSVEPTTEPSTPDVLVEKVAEEKEKKPVKSVFSHESFDQLLRKHVSSSGKVNYKAFKSDETKLDDYLKILENNPPQSDWSRSKQMAFWINAYNAATIKLILKNYPVSSITKLHGGKPWDAKWIKIGTKTYTLNNIENDIIRPKYKDARIHFAVNCAAKSCPPLLNKAWTASNLESNLEKQTRSFIQNSSQNSISKNAVTISKIFEWYAVDFGNIVNFLNKYSSTFINADAKVSYKEYDWSLNN